MLNWLKNIFTPPVFEDDEKTRMARLLYWISLTTWVVPVVLVVVYILNPANRQLLLPAIILLVLFLSVTAIIGRAGNIRASSMLLTIILVASGLFAGYTSAGELRPNIIYFAWIVIVAGLLLGGTEAIVIAVIFSIAQFIFSQLASNGLIVPISTAPTSLGETVVLFTGYLLVAFTFNLASSSIKNSLGKYRQSQKELSKTNKELGQIAYTLEERVKERTTALEKRASRLQIVSNVARSIASVQDINTLLSDVTHIISNQFGFYHVGVFLIDANREYAILRAANSEGGERMLNRQHKLRLDSNSIVGYVTSREEPRIALDVGADAVYFNNPDLLGTRSEMALPLRLAGRVIGALDVQSTEANAFTEEDIATLSILADQVAIAIENARLFSESHDALVESQGTFDKYVKQEWRSFAKQAKVTGFVYDGKRVSVWDGSKQPEQKRNIVQTGRLSLQKVSPTIAIPIKLRGQTIGMLDVRSKSGQREWTPDEITLLEAAAERAALALENARLVESAQRRAARERAIGEISSKIGTFSDMNAILQTAVEELGRRIGGATEVTLELVDDDTKTAS
ncbi:MAG: GAF domain-containing protein [Anaerolineales bacterium]